MIIDVVGIDPSLSNMGFAKAKLDVDTFKVFDINVHLVQTSPTKNKQTRRNSDDVRRATELYEAVQQHTSDTAISFVEVPHGSQSARAMTSYGVCVGLIPSIQSFSVIQLSEQDLKMATLGKKTGTKDEAIEWGYGVHPEANWFVHGGKLTKKNEHCADALAAIYAGLKTRDFKNAVSMLRYVKKAS